MKGMSMSPSAIDPNSNEDAVIEAQIQVELEHVNLSDTEDDVVAIDEEFIQVNAVLPSDEDYTQGIPGEVQSYFNALKSQRDAFERELEECDAILNYEPVKQESQALVVWEDVQVLENTARQFGLSVDEYKQKILKDIEEDDLCEISDDDVAEEEVNYDSMGNDQQNRESNLPYDENSFRLKPGEGIVAVVDETAKLEKEFRKQLKLLNRKQREEEEHEKELCEKRKREEEELKSKAEEFRQQKLLQLQEEEQKLTQENLARTQQFKEEDEMVHRQIAKEIKEHEEQINQLVEITKREKEEYEKKKRLEEKATEQRKNKAVLCIQRVYRGYRVRKPIGHILEEKKKERLKAKEELRIQELEKVIEQRKEEERQKKMEEERKIQAEKLQKQEEERKKKEEKKKLEEEKRRKEDDRKRKEEEKRIEEKRKKEEERLKIEKERLEKERREKEERLREEKRKEGEKKKEEERLRIEKERLEKERRDEEKKIIEEQKEAERLKQEEMGKEKERLERQEEENLRIEEERTKEEDKRKDNGTFEEEEKKEADKTRDQKEAEYKEKIERTMDATKKCLEKSVGEKVSPETKKAHLPNNGTSTTGMLLMNTLPSHIENKRLKWIKDCLPWSKVSNEPWKMKVTSKRKPARHPSSAKKLEVLPQSVILDAAKTETLRQVTTLELKDLPGYNLSTLSQCWGLKSLTMNNCNLISADGFISCKHLQYLNLQNNHLEYIDLKDLGNLQVVNLSNNKLSVIHGFTGCTNIRWLDLSYNKITRIGALESQRRLHTLNVSNNQLISTKGLDEAPTLQVLNFSKNHLQRLESIEKLCLLQKLDVSCNSLTEFPDIRNHVLLFHLDLHDNNITSLDKLDSCWLPLLTFLNISQNSLEELQPLKDCISLKYLYFCQNHLDSNFAVIESVKSLQSLEEISLKDNPGLDESDIRTGVSEYLSRLQRIDDSTIRVLTDSQSSEKSQTSFEVMYLSQAKAVMDNFKEFENQLKSADPSTICDIIFRFCERTFNIAVEYRYAHEYGEVMMKIPMAPSTPKTGSTLSIRKRVIQKEEIFSSPKDMFEQALKNTGSQQPTPMLVNSTKSPTKHDTSSLFFESNNSSQLTFNTTDDTADVLEELHIAATKIQALWRGYRFRCKLFAALEFAKFEEDDDDFCFEELDDELLNFDESKLDAEWKAPPVPGIPQKYPVLGLPPTGQKRNNEIPPLNLKTGQFHPPTHPVQAWQNMESPMTELSNQEMLVHRPPSSLHSTAIDTERTYTSKKEEQISEEWGFRDSKTAEMMLQRAKKMKYNALRKKKLSKLDPKQRFALFQKLEGGVTKPTPAVNRKMLPRKEYFQARQEAIDMEQQYKAEEKVTKINRTYQWIHTNVGDYEVTSSRINQKLNRADFYGSESNLPKLDAEIMSGGRVKLTASPVSCDLESVSTFNSRTRQRRYSVGSKNSSAAGLPSIKSGSAPTQKKGEKMSWRTEVNTSGGWGGGKKRQS